ncbi:MAG: endonuclease/exonuclease/phosphatase family protein, partial [Propionibacteriaceae bacterium]|nr:endonuclease/exonuclease/phosphatase family protein [Propionibacteriaceae bacterium]
MRLATFNVNGIRAASRRGFRAWLERADPDVVGLQEVRAPA